MIHESHMIHKNAFARLFGRLSLSRKLLLFDASKPKATYKTVARNMEEGKYTLLDFHTDNIMYGRCSSKNFSIGYIQSSIKNGFNLLKKHMYQNTKVKFSNYELKDMINEYYVPMLYKTLSMSLIALDELKNR